MRFHRISYVATGGKPNSEEDYVSFLKNYINDQVGMVSILNPQEDMNGQANEGEELLPGVKPLELAEVFVTSENFSLEKKYLPDLLSTFKFMNTKEMEKKNIALCFDVQQGIWINQYSELTWESLRAMLNNACYAMPNGGKIEIKAKREGSNTVLTFADTGCGMTSETLQKALGGGFTTRPTGTGRGLVLVRTYFEDILQGKFDITSEFGKGTKIQITLPCIKVL